MSQKETNSETVLNLPGKIAVISDDGDTCSIYNNDSNNKIQFTLNVSKQISYGPLIWSNQTDFFFAIQFIKNPDGSLEHANVVILDLLGHTIKTIFESNGYEVAEIAYPSRSDKLLLIETSDLRGEDTNPLWGLTHKVSISIMDLNTMKVVKKISNIGRIPNYYISESPWLFNENCFVFTITGKNKISVNKTIINPEKDSAGIYMYDLSTDKKTLIVPEGSLAVCTPVANNIAYIKDHSLWVQNMDNKKSKRLFKGDTKTTFQSIHWTPDGKYVYIFYTNKSILGTFSINEKLIDVETGKQKPFKGGIIGVKGYTWK